MAFSINTFFSLIGSFVICYSAASDSGFSSTRPSEHHGSSIPSAVSANNTETQTAAALVTVTRTSLICYITSTTHPGPVDTILSITRPSSTQTYCQCNDNAVQATLTVSPVNDVDMEFCTTVPTSQQIEASQATQPPNAVDSLLGDLSSLASAFATRIEPFLVSHNSTGAVSGFSSHVTGASVYGSTGFHNGPSSHGFPGTGTGIASHSVARNSTLSRSCTTSMTSETSSTATSNGGVSSVDAATHIRTATGTPNQTSMPTLLPPSLTALSGNAAPALPTADIGFVAAYALAGLGGAMAILG